MRHIDAAPATANCGDEDELGSPTPLSYNRPLAQAYTARLRKSPHVKCPGPATSRRTTQRQ